MRIFIKLIILILLLLLNNIYTSFYNLVAKFSFKEFKAANNRYSV